MTAWRRPLALAATVTLAVAGCGSSHHRAAPAASTLPPPAPSTTTAAAPSGTTSTTARQAPMITATTKAATPSTTNSTTRTTVAPAATAPEVLPADPSTVSELTAAFSAAEGIPIADIAGTVPGSVHVAQVAATSTSWAIANFAPAASDPPAITIKFQDGASYAEFARHGAGAWSVVSLIGEPFCPAAVPADVLAAWAVSRSPSCSS